MSKIRLFCKVCKFSFFLLKKSSKFLTLAYIAVQLIGSILPLFSMLSLKYIIDNLEKDSKNIAVYFRLILLYIFIVILMQIANSVKSILYENIYKKAEHEYDCIIAKKHTKLPLSIIDSSKGKDIVDDLRNSKHSIVYLSNQIISIIAMSYSFVVSFIVMCKYQFLFSVLFIALTIPSTILNIVYSKRLDWFRIKTAPDVRKFSYYRWMLTDSWPAKDVRMYDLTNDIKCRYNEEKNDYINSSKKIGKSKMFASIGIELLKRSGEVVFVIYMVVNAMSGKVTIGNMSFYIGLSSTISSDFYMIATIISTGLFRTTELSQRFFSFIEYKIDDKNNTDKKRHIKVFEKLEFDNVYFKYPTSDSFVLLGVSFVLNAGDHLSLVGVNGSGKTTIIKLMLGLYDIESGQILLNGYPISEYETHDLHQLFSVMFQDFVKYPLSIRDNITLSCNEDRDNNKKIGDSLEKSGLNGDYTEKICEDYDVNLTRQYDDNGIELSQGQWQSIALARVFFKDSPVLIFDEPSAALDAQAEDKLLNVLNNLSSNKTSIIISHRIYSSNEQNKIIVLDEGRVVEMGSHDELISNDGLYKKLYMTQRNKYVTQEKQ